MIGQKNLTVIDSAEHDFTIHPQAFVFFDKKTGTRRFEVKANADGGLPVDQVASLLAANCVMRGQTPRDFGVWVAAGEDLLGGLEKHAEKLIQLCQMFQSPIRLTKRQREVLHEVLQISSNKDIAEKVHISVRTVKFHISALLVKFGVASRMELMRKTFNLFSEEKSCTEPVIPLLVPNPAPGSIQERENLGNGRVQPNCSEKELADDTGRDIGCHRATDREGRFRMRRR
jgi:DNA-binding CsgD family transcriptional regulator